MKMKILAPLFVVLMLGHEAVFADWDPALEAREQAKRDLEARKDAEQERQAQQMKRDAQAKVDVGVMQSKRDTLGAVAKGKSDAEVNALYEARIKQDTAAAAAAHSKARAALGSGDGAAAVKQVTGKSMADMESMSDAELEALGREMEQKYGQ